MARHEYRVSEASRSALQPYADLARNDMRRVELFGFLAALIDEPRRATFEQDDQGLRWTWLEHVALVWSLDAAAREIDVIYVWTERRRRSR